MQRSYFVHTQQKDDSCEHHWMCIEDLLGGLDHVQCIHRQSLEESPHTLVSIHFYKTHLKFISESVFLLCWSMNWQDLGTYFDGYLGSSAERQWWLYSALCSNSVFKGNPLRTWIGLVQVHMKIQVCGFWNPHSPIYQTSEMLNISLPSKNSTFMETPNVSQAQEAMLKSYGLELLAESRLTLWASQCLQNKEKGYLGDMKHWDLLLHPFLRSTLFWNSSSALPTSRRLGNN